MKKFLALILAVMISAVFVACKDDETKKPQGDDINTEDEIIEEIEEEIVEEEEEKKEDESETKEENKAENDKPVEQKPSVVPEENKPSTAPADKKEENKPAEKPVEKPVETPAVSEKTLGNTLLAEFKANAKAGKSSEDIVSALSAKISAFGAIVPSPVAPGDYLPGFDNSEIKGFKSGVAFMPMIGSTPFVGYVFELDGTVGASELISTLKSNANMRWLICAEAEEMVAGSEGNKVFFVMCPKSIGE